MVKKLTQVAQMVKINADENFLCIGYYWNKIISIISTWIPKPNGFRFSDMQFNSKQQKAQTQTCAELADFRRIEIHVSPYASKCLFQGRISCLFEKAKNTY